MNDTLANDLEVLYRQIECPTVEQRMNRYYAGLIQKGDKPSLHSFWLIAYTMFGWSREEYAVWALTKTWEQR